MFAIKFYCDATGSFKLKIKMIKSNERCKPGLLTLL